MASTRSLAALATAKPRAANDSGEGDGDGGGKRRGKKGPKALRRPIICICNDLHAPVLRQLRKVAFEIVVPAIPTSRLVGRLEAICRTRRVQADVRSLEARLSALERRLLHNAKVAVLERQRANLEGTLARDDDIARRRAVAVERAQFRRSRPPPREDPQARAVLFASKRKPLQRK